MRKILEQTYLEQDWIKNQPQSFKDHALEDFSDEYEWKLEYFDYFGEPVIYSKKDWIHYIFRNWTLEKINGFVSENDLTKLPLKEFNHKFNNIGNTFKEQFSNKAIIENQLKIILSPEDTEKWFLMLIKENTDFSDIQKKDILKALDICKIKHKWQFRDEWIEYYWHPIFTAIKWLEHWLWYEDTIVLLLHDTIEDTDLTFEDIEKDFWRYVAEKVLSLSKTKNWKIIISKEDYYKNLSEDPKSAVLKWLDRLANVFSLNFATPERKKKYLDETKEIIIPIVSKFDSKLWEEIQKIVNHIENELFTLPPELVSKLDDIQKINKIKDWISK